MGIKKSYAVFGLGRYGTAVTKELLRNSADVLAIDANEETVNDVADEIPICKCADITDINVLKKLDISNFDVVIIAIASNLEVSVMATSLCKELGVKKVIVKCANEMHQKILKKVGADEVVFPENESGTRLAKNILSGNFIDMLELSPEIAILNISLPNDWIGKTLIELNLRRKYDVNVIAIQDGQKIITNIDPTIPLTENMELIVIANTDKIDKFLKGLKK